MERNVIVFTRSSLHYDISNMAYVAADIKEGTRDAHALHQTFDICGEGNADRVDSVLDLAFAEVLVMLGAMVTGGRIHGSRQGDFLLELKGEVPPPAVGLIREAGREYLVASALADWLAVTLPEAASAWREKASGAGSVLLAARRSCRVLPRRTSPIA